MSTPRSSDPAAQPRSARDGDREFRFTARDFERVRKRLYERAGIALSDGKSDMVYGRLARRLRALGLGRFDAYLDRLEAEPRDSEWQAFVNALTTNLTAFFREPHHFEAMARYLAEQPGGAHTRIWCAAASTGEEPYSIAMVAAESCPRFPPPVEILATDLDTDALARARRGVYELARIEDVDSERRTRFFLRGTGPNAGCVRVREPLRRMVRFESLNLIDGAWAIDGEFDLIFCRNVLIYFDKPTQHRIVERLHRRLRPGGLLMAGHSESYLNVPALFTPCGRTIYRRRSGPGDPVAGAAA